MLGGAFTARGVFVVQEARSDNSYIAFSVLESVAPNFISLVNSLLLINLMRGLNAGPPKHMLKMFWAFSVTTSVTFGAISAAGSIILTGDSTSGQLNTGIKLVKASIAGQMANSLLFIVFASVLILLYRESLGRRAWVFIIYVGGLLMIARNAARIVMVFYTSNTLMRDSEAAYYCLEDAPVPVWKDIHQRAVDKGEQTYIDPATGYTVFTELSHRDRGYCCGNACRHCPFEHDNVGKPDKLKQQARAAREARKQACKASKVERPKTLGDDDDSSSK
ncbi:hypothetical protein GGI17_003116 [Coemansia sp. S146]|nr:hypothetical protein GGI17_003116 [Coemansia sp. S146]